MATKELSQADSGLEDIIATSTSVCSIENGVLAYRGYNIDDLAVNTTFGEVTHLLFYGQLPNRAQLEKLEREIAEQGKVPEASWKIIKAFPLSVPPMDWLRSAVSVLSFADPDSKDNSAEANLRKSIRLTGQISTLVAAYDRMRNNKEILDPKPGKSQAWNFLHQLTGKEPDETSVKTFDVCLILHADHELNASTFSARVTAATLSDVHSAVTSAIGTLKGPLHGGANEQVMIMLKKIGDASKVESWIHEALARKDKIMGFGHRVYKNGDPRAKHLMRLSEQMGKLKGDTKWFEMSKVIDGVVQKEKKLLPNVDFYSASTYHYLGIPTDIFTPIFACSRITGWTAHVMEQLAHNRLIRPRAEYLGARDQKSVPIDKR
ncbi:MAG TPA: citrate/2-methylcitrate synthase [bacterium]|nr:citrate/2-methylcitrate synthase [bacterium]